MKTIKCIILLIKLNFESEDFSSGILVIRVNEDVFFSHQRQLIHRTHRVIV